MAQAAESPMRVVKQYTLSLDGDNDDGDGRELVKDRSPGSPLFLKKASSGGRMAAMSRSASAMSSSTQTEDSSDDELGFGIISQASTESRVELDNASTMDTVGSKTRTLSARTAKTSKESRKVSAGRTTSQMSKRMTSMLSIAESIPEDDAYGRRSSIFSIMTDDQDTPLNHRSSRRQQRVGHSNSKRGGGGAWPQQDMQQQFQQQHHQQPAFAMPPMQHVQCQMMGFPMLPPMMQPGLMAPGIPPHMAAGMQPVMPGMPPMSAMPPAFPPQGVDWQQHAAATAAAQAAASAAYAAAYQQSTRGVGGPLPHVPPMAPPMQQPYDAASVRTTVMLRNVPETFTRDMLTKMLDREGFHGRYDFVYMPMNFRTKSSFGYAFVNMVEHADAVRIHKQFEGFHRWGVESEKICEVSWSDMHQGLVAHIDRYRNSPVMHESVPDQYKPATFAFGARVAFPSPTKKLRGPRIRRPVDASGASEDDEDTVDAAADDAAAGGV